jgi:hypothetical protein
MPAIATYRVGLNRSHKVGPTRWLTLTLESAIDGARAITLFFHEKEVSVFGFLNRQTSRLIANLPAADFEPTYAILQTEKPVFAHYRLDVEEDRLLSIEISTSEEPLGEGHMDRSA